MAQQLALNTENGTTIKVEGTEIVFVFDGHEVTLSEDGTCFRVESEVNQNPTPYWVQTPRENSRVRIFNWWLKVEDGVLLALMDEERKQWEATVYSNLL
ncbi:hypothetical protein [Shimazuella alba]|uniref:Uncharacterized protein n=1 Tax=Shimazuella alba TaxID=2690964 RepID=A0A6I4VRG4_9BACL|nr:hypothetical protein [Shimazuella alba]MXQ52370.1 hypothetical protein [Shimazuella alba]